VVRLALLLPPPKPPKPPPPPKPAAEALLRVPSTPHKAAVRERRRKFFEMIVFHKCFKLIVRVD